MQTTAYGSPICDIIMFTNYIFLSYKTCIVHLLKLLVPFSKGLVLIPFIFGALPTHNPWLRSLPEASSPHLLRTTQSLAPYMFLHCMMNTGRHFQTYASCSVLFLFNYLRLSTQIYTTSKEESCKIHQNCWDSRYSRTSKVLQVHC